MSFCTEQVLSMASGIYYDLGSPTDISIGYISGWITASGGMLGSINTRLSTNFYLSGDAPCITNGFGDQEEALGALMFKSEYYERRSFMALTSMSIPWTTIKDGDSTLTRESASSISKAFLGLHENAEEQIRITVANWKRGATNVASVDAQSLYSWPSP